MTAIAVIVLAVAALQAVLIAFWCLVVPPEPPCPPPCRPVRPTRPRPPGIDPAGWHWADYEPTDMFLEAHRAQDRSAEALAREIGVSYSALLASLDRWKAHRPPAETIHRFHGAN